MTTTEKQQFTAITLNGIYEAYYRIVMRQIRSGAEFASVSQESELYQLVQDIGLTSEIVATTKKVASAFAVWRCAKSTNWEKVMELCFPKDADREEFYGNLNQMRVLNQLCVQSQSAEHDLMKHLSALQDSAALVARICASVQES